MSQAPTHDLSPETEFERQKHELARQLLAPDSPVSSESAFRRLRSQVA